MSHAYGSVIKNDKVVAHFEYNGMFDEVIPTLWNSREEVAEHWRSGEWRTCECNGGEPVTLYSEYGSGFHWPGVACLKCMAITDGFKPHPQTDGHPLGYPHPFDEWMKENASKG